MREETKMPMAALLRPAVFLDRDGTVIEDRGVLGEPSNVAFFPNTVDALRRLQEHFLLLLVTNQPGVARGVITLDDVARVNARVVSHLAEHGVMGTAAFRWRTPTAPDGRTDLCRPCGALL